MSNIKELSDKKVLSEAKRYQAQWQKNHLDGYAQEMATKYHIGDHSKEPFFKEMVTLWVRIKEATGKDPHEWLKHYDTKTFEKGGAIGWIDALNAIEAVAKAYIKLNKEEHA